MKIALVKLHHPENDREKLYLKVRRDEDRDTILWAHFDVKQNGGHYKRIWLAGLEQAGRFESTLVERGYELDDVRMQISEWLEREDGGLL